MKLLCAGAAQGLIKSLQDPFMEASGVAVEARFGAVGAMKEALLSGEPCDVFIVTEAMVDQLVSQGQLTPGTGAAIGRVRTGVAARAGDESPDISTPERLAAALRAAPAIYFPDAERSTAGAHFASVLARLGLADELRPRLRMFPNGATAMRELAADASPGVIGCTQISEILYTPGARLLGALPSEFELATVYAAAVSHRATHPEAALRFIELITGPTTRLLREQGGFDID